ncbi:MAG: hypothetical protein JXB10_06335 [Pirellulales bacterium]|nr:hypothetical protein [Pirellulales bacterium]
MADASADIQDQLLVMDALDGDARAMEKLVGRWQKRLWLHAFRLTADHHAAWDVTQQSRLGIIKVFTWLMIHRNDIKREIKRLELRIAELAAAGK